MELVERRESEGLLPDCFQRVPKVAVTKEFLLILKLSDKKIKSNNCYILSLF